MQNLLPMRLVFVGASTPVFDGDETTAVLVNVFEPKPTGAFEDLSVGASLLDALFGLSMTAFTGVRSWLLIDMSSEACLWCRLERVGGCGSVEDCCKTSDWQVSLVPGAELLKLSIQGSLNKSLLLPFFTLNDLLRTDMIIQSAYARCSKSRVSQASYWCQWSVVFQPWAIVTCTSSSAMTESLRKA